MTKTSQLNGMEEITTRVREISAENDRLFKRLLEGEKHFRRLAKSVLQVQEEERRRLALDLHDGIGQTLTALKNHLQRQRANCSDPALQDGLSHAFELAAMALADTRELSRLLRPPVLDDLGLRAGLDWLARIQRERVGLPVRIEWMLDADRMEPEIETLVFRSVQEALTNTVKHANASQAIVHLDMRDTLLLVQVEDDGAGFEPEAALAATDSGFGLRGLRDRVELFGGHLKIEKKPERGTRLQLLLPLGSGSNANGE